MNRVFKKVWNGLRQSVVVVSEASSSQAGKTCANVGTVSAKAGVMAAVSIAVALASSQVSAETAFKLDALSPEDVIEVTSIPGTVDEANGAQSAVYADTVLSNTAVDSDKTALVFASEDYSEHLFYTESNRITLSMGFKGIVGATGGVEVADGMHLVLVGESVAEENAKDFDLVDGDLYVHGQANRVTSRVTLGSYATEEKTAGHLNDIYVGVQPDNVGHANNGQLYVRHGDFTAKTLYLGGEVFIGGGAEAQLPEDSAASLTVDTLSAESSSRLHNWGIFTASTISMPSGTANAQLRNYGTMKIIGEGSSFNGFIDNGGIFTGTNLTLSNGLVPNNDGELDFAPSQNMTSGTMTLTNLTLQRLTKWDELAFPTAGGLRNLGMLVITEDLLAEGWLQNDGVLSVGDTLTIGDSLSDGIGKVVNNADASITTGYLDLNHGTLVNDGLITVEQPFVIDSDSSLTGTGSLIVPSITLENTATSIEQNQLTITAQGASVNNGVVTVSELTGTEQQLGYSEWLNNGALTVDTMQDLQLVNGNTSSDATVTINKNATLVSLNNKAGSVTGENDSALTIGQLTLSGGTVSGDFVKLTSDSANASQIINGTLNANVLDITNSRLDIKGGEINANSILSAGASINFTGSDWRLTEGTWFNDATLTFLVDYSTEDLGENTVNVMSDVTVDTLTGATKVTLHQDASLTVTGDISLGDKTLTLDGGKLVTSLDEIFSSVNADETLEGTNVETGESVTIAVSGIQSVGAVQESVVSGINYVSGTFEFIDNGWTVNAVNSAASQLQSAFGEPFSQGSTLVFSGTQDSESGAFDVEDANQLASGVVLSNTILEAGNQNLTFGESTETELGALVTVPTVGFQAIATAGDVTVTDGHHLYLTGFENDQGTTALLTDHEDGAVHVNENGHLTLGLNGHQTGGALGMILANNGHIEVAQNGTFSVGALTAIGDSSLSVAKDGTLTISRFSDSETTQSTIDGTLIINSSATVLGQMTNRGAVTINGASSFADLNNSGRLESINGFNGTKLVNSGVIQAQSVNVGTEDAWGTLQNQNGAELTATESVTLSLTGENANAGNMTAAGINIALDTDAVFNNSGTITSKDNAKNIILSGAEGAKFINSGTLETAALTISGLQFETTSKVTTESLEMASTDFIVADTGSIEVEKIAMTDNATIVNNGSIKISGNENALTLTDSALTNNGELSASTVVLGETAKVTNNGQLGITDLTLNAAGAITQSDDATVNVKNLTVKGDSFDLGSGTWMIGSESGIKFVNEEGQAQAGEIDVTSGKELVVAGADIDNTVYHVTKSLTFGSQSGLAENLGIKATNGVLTVDKGVEIGTGGEIHLGQVVQTVSTRTASAFSAAADTVTVFTGNAFGADGSEAGILAGVEGLTAIIDKDAKAVLTGVAQSGQYTLLDGFDLSANLDENGQWTGGWTGENAQYVNVDNGSDLQWKVDATYEDNAIVADVTAADVRSVYNFSTPDIANAALSSKADPSKGADVTFMQAVINNKTLDVAQTERIVNSVTQIAAALGTTANVLADATGLMDTVESRMGILTDSADTGLWVHAEGGKYSMDGLKLDAGLDAGYDTKTYGVTFGADGLVTPALRVGASFSYLNGSADAEGDVLSGSNDYDTYGLQAYASYGLSDTMNISGEFGWFHSSSELSQSIAFADVQQAKADVDTDAITLGVRGEWRFDVNGVAVVPHIGLRGVYMMNDAYTTTIDGKEAFRNDQDNTFTMQVPVGVTFEKAFETASGWTVVPSADVTVAAQFGDTDYDTKITGVGTGVSETVNADMAGDVLGRVAFGVKAGNGTSTIGAYYGFTAGDAGRQDHAFKVEMRYAF